MYSDVHWKLNADVTVTISNEPGKICLYGFATATKKAKRYYY